MSKPLTEIAYDALYDKITTGKIMPGNPINEVELAKSLGISRTPIRNAIAKLEKDGLLERKNGRIYAIEITYSRAADLSVLRASIEGIAARLAASSASKKDLEHLEKTMAQVEEAVAKGNISTAMPLHLEYHIQIVRMSQNCDLIAASANADALTRRFRRISAQNFGRLSQSIISHKAIFNAIVNRDAERSEQLMREDVLGGGAALLHLLEAFFGIDKITPSVSMVLRHAGTYQKQQMMG